MYPLFGLIGLLARLPYRIRLKIGRLLGHFYYGLATKDKRVAMINLQLCFPELSLDKRRAICHESFISLATTLIEAPFLMLSNKTPLDHMLAHIDGAEHFFHAKQQGRGVMILFPHLTPVFFVGYLCWRALGLDIGFMYRPSQNPVLAKKFAAQFVGAGQSFTHRQAKPMIDFLQQGGVVWYAPDLLPKRQERVFAPFFGIPTATGTAAIRFAALSGATVLVVGFRRDATGRFHVRFQPPLTDFPSEDPIQDATRVNAAIAEQIQAYPEAYLWLYKRFKQPPPGGVNPYT